MNLLSVPVVPLPRGGITKTPKSVPVVFEGEHVADAHLRDDGYYFRMFQGDLQTGLMKGTLLYRPHFRDTPACGAPQTREYLAIEIVRNI